MTPGTVLGCGWEAVEFMIIQIRPLRIGRRGVLAAASGLLASPSIARAQAQTGVALVIGNSKYKWEASLPNVRRDAPDVAKRFRDLGFKAELLQDAGRDAMFAAVDKFKSAASGANLAVVYFSGHGASWENETYLVPVDADLANADIAKTLLPASAIRMATQGAAHRLMVFDNCRNNPADGWRQRSAAGSAAVTSAELAATALNGPNTLLIFSTAPGRVALDGPAGENSPFAAAFLRELEGPSIDLAGLAAKLRRNLMLATNGRQVIWDESTFDQPFAIKGLGGASRAASSSVPAARVLELPKAYAFAQEKRLALPPGLVAIRPPAATEASEKIGSFASSVRMRVGYATSAGISIEPLIVILLAINDGIAQCIFCSRLHLWDKKGVSWQLLDGRLNGDELVFSPFGYTEAHLRWKDANNGTFEMLRSGALIRPGSDRLTRLD